MQINKLARHAVALLLVLMPALAVATPAGTKQPVKPPSTTTQKTQKTIVLVHGAFADGGSWRKVIPMLEAKGYSVIAVHLPMTSVADDVAATKRAIEQAEGDVVLVGHSYGGVVISMAGNDDKVKSLVFVDAFGLDDGESINGLSKDNPPAWTKTIKIDSGGFGWLPAEEGAKNFAQDLPPAEQKLLAATQGPFPMKGFDQQMKNPAWKKKPNWYVRGTADHAIAPEAQAQMAKRMKAKVTSIDASHLSMLAKPREVSNVIIDAAKAQDATATR
jgi:pimeloyl-ACP methyl ester carboxylesterase